MIHTVLRRMALLLCTIFLAIIPSNAREKAPVQITGSVVEAAAKKPIAYATIAIFSDSTKLVKAEVTDADGKFKINIDSTGQYIVRTSFVGYTPSAKQIEIGRSDKNVDLGQIEIVEGLEIGAVKITAQRPLVTTDIDKVTYNTEADPETATTTALEMMRKVPMLSVDGEDKITLKGQSNFKILVNGKTSTLMSNNYKDVLKSMPASSIKSIEVITDPPAKYDAEGIGGIINIITNRKTNNGYNGSVGVGANNFGGVNWNAYMAAAIGKFNISANYFGGRSQQPESSASSLRENYESLAARYITTDATSRFNGFNNGLSLEGSYEIDTFNLITISMWGYLGNYDNNSNMYSGNFTPELLPTQEFRTLSQSKRTFGSIEGTIDYQRTFNKPDQSFTVSYKLNYNPNSSSFENNIEEIINYNPYQQKSDNTAWGGEHTFQADYFDPLAKKHQIETGIKYILRPNRSNTENWRKDGDGEWYEDKSRKNDLDYNQHIGSAYLGYLFKLTKFSVKLGMRAEYTINEGTFRLKEDVPLFNRYFNVVPYATLSYKFTESQNMRLGYTQRLSRPGIWYLNPYVNDQNPQNISTGNPLLSSEISHSVNLSYGIYKPKFNINASVSGNLMNNSIQEVSTIRTDGVKVTTYDNIGKSQNLGFSLYGALRLLDNKLSFNLSGGTNYTNINANNNSGLHNNGWSFYGNANVYARPWKGGNVSANFGMSGGYVSLQSQSPTYVYYSVGAGQAFLKEKLRLSVSVSNPFEKERHYSYDSYGVGFRESWDSWSPSRSIRVNLNWRFGKMQTQVKKAKRGITNDDMKSSGGDSAPAGN